MKQIDALTDNKVYADPVKAMQEEMLKELLQIRKSFAAAIDKAVSMGGGGAGAAASGVSKEEHDKVVLENAKLKYRIRHLCMALDEKDGVKPRAANVQFKVQVDSQESLNTVQVVADLVGAKLTVEFVTPEQRKSKEYSKVNPTDRFPLLQAAEGVITGTWPICKYICKQTHKLLGSTPLDESKVLQWIGWNAT